MADKTCFVISPLSERGSEIRKEADDLLWVINQAVAKHGFKVVRIDEISKSHEITREIVRYVKESERCIIILTGNNPNVFYEAGRRHEAGKPFIHLLKEGEKLPFDVAFINTIHYGDITNLDGAKELAAAVERFVANMASEIDGQHVTPQTTLELIAEMLARLDRKVSRLASVPPASGLGGPLGLDDPRAAMRNPREAFMLAIAEGDINGATALLRRLEELMGRNKEFHQATLMCAQAGSAVAADIAKDMLTTQPEWFEEVDIVDTIGGLVSYFYLTDREPEGIDFLFPIIDRELQGPTLIAHDKAQLLNQKQRLLFGMKRYEEARPIAEEILQLQPNEPAFYHNASMIYEALKEYSKAAEITDKLLELEVDDPLHLAQAVDVYVADNQRDKAKRIFRRLQETDPRRAALKLLNNEVRVALGDT